MWPYKRDRGAEAFTPDPPLADDVHGLAPADDAAETRDFLVQERDNVLK
jgi:hypothetical protein